jgi:hypothetical protein
MLNILKKQYPNIYVIIISLAVALWFSGCNRLIDHFSPNNVENGLLLCVISLIIVYMDDGKLNELHNADDNTTSRNAAAILTGGYE